MNNNNLKYIAIFLAVIMVGAVFAIAFTAISPPEQNDEQEQERMDPIPFNAIPGETVNSPINSISDALDLTPGEVASAQFVDVSKVRGTSFEMLFGESLDNIERMFNSKLINTYIVTGQQSSFELSTIEDDHIGIPFGEPYMHKDYPILPVGEAYFMSIGTPMALGQQNDIESFIDIIVEEKEGNDQFESILEYADVNEHKFQQVIGSGNNHFDLLYVGYAGTDTNEYARQAIYENPSEELVELIDDLSETDNLEYTVEEIDDILKVTIQGSFELVLSEPIEPDEM
ncbi:hypothetical protein [Methanosalsum natronophilum]|uniref:hypothetical protein n=1 Tax=Methanosalsum natronophilum TaxID=768733 RepID=UPI00216A8DC3|nr:hypothetical protein [Methanosalsum natronophilum]MCS3923252.1 surface glycoprotein (TIGR04207 family) [Methanosalsum natronophilum]